MATQKSLVHREWLWMLTFLVLSPSPPNLYGKWAMAIMLYTGKLGASLIFWDVSLLASCTLSPSLCRWLAEGSCAASPGAPHHGGTLRKALTLLETPKSWTPCEGSFTRYPPPPRGGLLTHGEKGLLPCRWAATGAQQEV
jgi:hypothetical protein